MRKAYDITIRGTAEPRRVRAEVVKDGSTIARSPWIELAAGQERVVQVTVDAPAGEYEVRQATNVGSNVHEDHAIVALEPIQHG